MSIPRVVVLGGGFAGLESAFYLRHKLHDKVDLTLVSDRDYFLFKPNTIYIPFGEDPEKFKIPLDKPTHRKDIRFVQGTAQAIMTDPRKVLVNGSEIPFDYLVVALGASMRPEEIPGMKEHAITVWTPEEMLRLRSAYLKLIEDGLAGRRRKLLFLIPPNNRCAGPLYEMVLMTDTWLREHAIRSEVEITWATYEDNYIQAFGPRLNTVVMEEFHRRGIHGIKSVLVSHIEPEHVHFRNGDVRPYDLLISFPPYIAHQWFQNLPTDQRGFIRVDRDTRRVQGFDRIFAVGDAADFPIKQAFLALLQADAAAEQIAAEIEHRQPELAFEPMSMCVMEEFDKATFAQVPLKYTDDPVKPVSVSLDDPEHYKVGVSPIWRMGKKVLGLYLPWRFGNGEPFHAGLAWDTMDLGLKVMSKVLAH
ncbi:MAG: FAD-dependent oxidoreductase [Bryobacteraceae bacterium]